MKYSSLAYLEASCPIPNLSTDRKWGQEEPSNRLARDGQAGLFPQKSRSILKRKEVV